jgi:hypothetical protein
LEPVEDDDDEEGGLEWEGWRKYCHDDDDLLPRLLLLWCFSCFSEYDLLLTLPLE